MWNSYFAAIESPKNRRTKDINARNLEQQIYANNFNHTGN